QEGGNKPVPNRRLSLFRRQLLVLKPGLEEGQGDDGQCSGQFHDHCIGSSDGTIDGGCSQY
ncbi:hypothetical protein, partial [Methanothrix sp.]|uniref:hypothetical protein n=1 Tax=Methanothrix sp. TaxID=90426 RepID=UPI003C781AF3